MSSIRFLPPTLALACALTVSIPARADTSSASAAIQKERKVVDFLHQTSGIKWNVGVLPDGSKRHGYASYICELLREHGVVTSATRPRAEIVRIVDMVKVKQGVRMSDASLGMVDCATYERLD